MSKKIVLMIDEAVTENDALFGINTLINKGHTAEIYRISNYFTDDLTNDLYRFAAEFHVSRSQLNKEFKAHNKRRFEKEDSLWDQYDMNFEDYCWLYAERILNRDVGNISEIACVVGTNNVAVEYIVDHLRIRDGSVMAIIPEVRMSA